jgi:hypothetical protein
MALENYLKPDVLEGENQYYKVKDIPNATQITSLSIKDETIGYIFH